MDVEWNLDDRLFSEDEMYSFVKSTAAAKELEQTGRALVLMKKYHDGQYRMGKDTVPYISHPLMMACHAIALGIEEDDMLAAILLHDVVEDCDVTVEELDVNDTVKEAVTLLTFTIYEGKSREESKEIYFRNLSNNRIASVVKLLDRCNNISTMATGFSKEKMAFYIKETEKLVPPVIEKVKNEYPEYYNISFLLEYQMKSVIETLKRIM